MGANEEGIVEGVLRETEQKQQKLKCIWQPPLEGGAVIMTIMGHKSTALCGLAVS